MSRTKHARRKRGTKKPIPAKAGRSEYTRPYEVYEWVLVRPSKYVVDRVAAFIEELHNKNDEAFDAGKRMGLKYASFDYPSTVKTIVQLGAERRTWAAQAVNHITKLTGVEPLQVKG